MVNLAVEYARENIPLQKFEEALSPSFRVDVPMVPGVGLYLDELSFETYNLRLQTQATQHKRFLANKAFRDQKEKGASSEAEVLAGADEGQDKLMDDDASQQLKRQKCDSADDDKDGDDDKVIHLPLEWSKLPDISSRLQHFRSAIIWPHVAYEEKNSLSFVYYLDFLRVSDAKYVASTNVPYGTKAIAIKDKVNNDTGNN
jgi:hypothetical protein